MPKLERIELWRLPFSFYDAPDDATRFAMLAAVTVPAIELAAPRQPPPMKALHQAMALLLCATIGLPLMLLAALAIDLALGRYTDAFIVCVVALVLALHPLPWGRLAYRRSRAGLLLAQYFGLEIIVDRAAGPLARAAATPATLAAGHPDGATVRQTAVVNLACPHGVINFGAVVFASLSRWLTGSDQLTSVADATGATPGVRHFLAPTWPISASRSALLGHMARGCTIGLVPDGIGGIFASSIEAGRSPAWGEDLLAVGKRRGLMRLLLQTGATAMPGYFVGTLQLFTIWQDPLGILHALSRRLRLSLFLFYGRFGLPLPRRGPITAVVAFVPAPGAQRVDEPSQEQLDEHHERVYGALVAAYGDARAALGLPPSARLWIK